MFDIYKFFRHFLMKDLDTVKKRLLEYLRANRISQSEFGRIMGVSRSYVSTMREGMSFDKVDKLREKFPSLNLDWLLYGEGDMTIQDNSISVGRDNNGSINSYALEKAIDEIAEQRKLTAESQRQVDRLLSIIEGFQKGA